VESIKGYDDYKGASPIDDGFIEISTCYYCGIEDSDDVMLVNVYEEDINKDILVCDNCIDEMRKGRL